MSDHDQRFKVLLHEFLAEFVGLFFPEWAARLDLTHPEWLEQELQLDPPQGEKHEADLVARVPARPPIPPQRTGEPESAVILVHIEVEWRDSADCLRPRLVDLFRALRRKHGLPVLPIVLYLRVGFDGIGWDGYEERLWDRVILRYEYPYVGLPALDAEPYLHGANLLGVALAALMRVPRDRQALLKAEAEQRVADSGENEARRYLLAECLDAYFPLEGEQGVEYERLSQTEPYRRGREMTTSFIERGRQLERREVLRKQLTKRFGPLSAAVEQRLQSLSMDRMEELLLAILDARSLKDLGLED
jgi:hypothetical protein